MAEENLTPENTEESVQSALEALEAEVEAATEALHAEVVNPFSDPNTSVEPEAPVAADAQQAVQNDYTQPTQVFDAAAQQQPFTPASQPFTQSAQDASAQQPFDQGQYGQAQPQYGQPQYGQPMAPQYANGSNLGTTPLVLGILSLVAAIIFGWTFIGPIAGIVLGALGISKGSKILKSDPANGRAKGGKVTGIIGLILSILALLFTIVLTVVIGMAAVSAAENPEALINTMEEIAATDSTGQSQELVDSMKEELGMNTGSTDAGEGAAAGSEDEAAAIAAVEEALSVLKNPSDADRAEIEKSLSESFESTAGFSLDTLGIQPSEFVSWMLDDISYTTEGATIMSDGMYGWVDLKVTNRDLNDFMTQFNNGVSEFMSSADYGSISNEEEAYKKVGDIMRDAMSKTATSEKSVSVDVEKATKDSAWKCSDSSLEYAYYQLFGI